MTTSDIRFRRKLHTESDGKVSCCYGCGAPLKKLSMLVCPECLDAECEQFEELVDSGSKKE